MIKISRMSRLLLLLLTSLSAASAMAQHGDHGGPHFGISEEQAGVTVQTSPMNDEVLRNTPAALGLVFDKPVRLVKLALYNSDKDWVDISFRYNPKIASSFSWSIPILKVAPYYSVEWAILDGQGRLVKGNYSFAFGADADAPSVTRRQAMMHDQGQHAEHDSQMRGQMPMPKGG